MKFNYIICHYSEIGLKGSNRKFFEEKLIENIKKALKSFWYKKIQRISGEIIIQLTSRGEKEQKEIKEKLKNIFGLAYFAFGINCEQKLDIIKKETFEMLSTQKFKTFRISSRRSKKDFYLTSQQINEKVGEYILKEFPVAIPLQAGHRREKILQDGEHSRTIRVNLNNPDITCFIEIVEKYAFLYLEKISGQGGLPVGVSGRALSLLSGGIDSPVASFYCQRRGLDIIFVHFTSYPFVKKSSIEKVKKIVKVLNKFQPQLKLYLVPFTDIQKQILLKTKADLRVILYRRIMFKIAELIAKKEKIKALITGENLGQVASQTLDNMFVVEKATNLFVFRPLIGFDKQDIIEKAKEIGTFDISILPGDDCCQRFLPEHPETRADLKEVEIEEKKLDLKKLINKAFKDIKVEEIKNPLARVSPGGEA